MIKYIVKHIIFDIFYFPIWWYSKGLIKVLKWSGKSILKTEENLAIKIWIKSMFKPMFQDYTREGRIVSFFMRVVILIFKLIALILWTLTILICVSVWIILPVISFYLLISAF